MTSTQYISFSKIYKITNTVDDKFYVGSTIYTLEKRLKYHKLNVERRPTMPVYKHIEDNVGWENISIELLEQCQGITTKDELRQREQHYINLLKDDNCLNVRRA